MIICGEVDCREGHIAEQARGSAFVETDKTKIAHNPHGGAPGGAFDGFRDFALDLETDLDDFEGVGEDLLHETSQYRDMEKGHVKVGKGGLG